MTRLFLSMVSLGIYGTLVDATTFLHLSEGERIRQATEICAVTIQHIEVGEKVTTATGRVEECFKGVEKKNEISIVWPGRKREITSPSGKRVMTFTDAIGTPDLKKDESALLYLSRENAKDPYTILSWAQGVTRLQRDAANNEFKISSKPERLDRVKKNKSSRQATQRGPANLKEFRALVQQSMSAQ